MTPWRRDTVPGAVLEGDLRRKTEPITRMVEVMPRFGLSTMLLHVCYHLRPDDLLYLPATHNRHWQEAQQLYGAVPFASSLHLSRAGDTHAHDIAPIEVFPRLEAHMRAELEAGVSPRSLKLSGRRLLELLDEDQHRPEMFARMVYDLPGLIDYIRVRPRIEQAKWSDSHRNITDTDVKESAEFYLLMRRENGGRNPASSRIFNVTRRTAEELAAHRAACRLEAAERRERRERCALERRCLEAAERREHLDVEHLDVEHLDAEHLDVEHLDAEHLDVERQRHRAAQLTEIHARRAAALLTCMRHRAARRRPSADRPVSRTAYTRRTRTAPTRAPPRRRPRPGQRLPAGAATHTQAEPLQPRVTERYHRHRPDEANRGEISM